MKPILAITPVRFICLAWLVLILAVGSVAFADGTNDVRAVLQRRVAGKQGVGIVVGLLDAEGRQVVSSGAGFDGDTVFEIASVTKVFTALLLELAVERGEVGLEDPARTFLPAKVTVPTNDGKPITLLQLATHTSGLPRMPSNFAPKDSENPYADYTVARMEEFLADCKLPANAGAHYEYSNFGFGLLGHILAVRAGTNFEALVRTRIFQPLKMDSTVIELSPALRARLAAPHNRAGQPSHNWDFTEAFQGGGSIRSTVNDMLKFAASNLGPAKTRLEMAMAATHRARFKTEQPHLSLGLGWHILDTFGNDVVWHNGETGGYHSFLGLIPQTHRAVVVLSNCAANIDDIGFHLLDARYKLADEPKKEE